LVRQYNHIEIELSYPTIPSNSYPISKQEISVIHIDFLDSYPFQAPRLTVKTPIFHPNVYTSGLICLGSWNPTEFLDFLVKRIVHTICFDPQFINPDSPANYLASVWYRKSEEQTPDCFQRLFYRHYSPNAPTPPRGIFRYT
jgi:ubiquitin-protein ligase